MALTPTGQVIELADYLHRARRAHDEAVIAAARAIDREGEADLLTQRARILIEAGRITHLERMLAHAQLVAGCPAA